MAIESLSDIAKGGVSAFGAGVSSEPSVNDSTTARILGLVDAGTYLRMTNAAATTVTVAPQASVSWPSGTAVSVRRVGAGVLTLSAGAGVTLNPPSGGTLTMTAGMTVTMKQVGTDEWDVMGQTVAV